MRATAVRQAPVTAAAIVLLVTSIATVGLPLGGAGCPPAVAALTAVAKPLPTGGSPAQDRATIEADRKAVSAAEAANNDALTALAQAQSRVQAAADLQRKADERRARRTASADSSSSTIHDAQARVDADQVVVELVKGNLKTAQDMATTDPQYGADPTFHLGMVADAQAQLDQEKTTLAKDQAQLAAVTNAASSAATARQRAQSNADKLVKQAKDAEPKADAAMAAVQPKADSVASALRVAQATQTQHQQAQAAEQELWHHQHRLAVAAVKARNNTAADCRVQATGNAAVGGGLMLSAALLILLATVPRRRLGVAA